MSVLEALKNEHVNKSIISSQGCRQLETINLKVEFSFCILNNISKWGYNGGGEGGEEAISYL